MGRKQKYPECIDLLVNNGRLEALDYYLDELDKRRIEYRKDLAKSIRHIKEELEEVNIKYRFQKITYKNIFPASQWAQSLDNIFIEIKFAHRHDSPGCLEVEDNHTFYTMDKTGHCLWSGNSSTLSGHDVSHNILDLRWEGHTLVGEMKLHLSPGFKQYGICSTMDIERFL